jgi:trehalose 2-sulfotransferase
VSPPDQVNRPRSSYLLCGTPRTGSTLLCDLLASTGVAGRPESYFREPDQAVWATRFGMPVAGDGTVRVEDLVAGAIREGTTTNGVFGARVMWGTMEHLVGGLRPSRGGRDIDALEEAFGPLQLVHLRRRDVVRQAVSWARAEQTGYWQEGDVATAEPHLDLDQVDHLVRTIRDHDAGWSAWFAEQAVRPHVVTYEDLVEDPDATVRGLLGRLGIEPPPYWVAGSSVTRQGDGVNDDWVRRYDQRA